MAFRYPLDKVTITQGFANANVPYAQYGAHNGIDLAAPNGTPVFAADEGTVAFEGWGQNHSWMAAPAGICVLINHIGSYAGYAHLSSTVVSKGQKVAKGQLIGYVGATGAATGPHLHFEMLPLVPNFKNGFAGRIDPTPFIETVKTATEAQVRQAYLNILERPADAGGISHYIKYPIDFVLTDLTNSAEKRTLDARKAAAAKVAAELAADQARKAAEKKAAEEAAKKAQEELDRLEAERKAAEESAKEKAGQYDAILKENNTLLKTILALLQTLVDKLTSIFK